MPLFWSYQLWVKRGVRKSQRDHWPIAVQTDFRKPCAMSCVPPKDMKSQPPAPQNLTLFGNASLKMELVRMRSYWDPWSNVRQRTEGCSCMPRTARDWQLPPEAGRDKGGRHPEPQRERGPALTLGLDFELQNCEIKIAVLSHQLCGTSLWQAWNTINSKSQLGVSKLIPLTPRASADPMGSLPFIRESASRTPTGCCLHNSWGKADGACSKKSSYQARRGGEGRAVTMDAEAGRGGCCIPSSLGLVPGARLLSSRLTLLPTRS